MSERIGWLFEECADLCGVDSLQALQLAASVDCMLNQLRHRYEFFGLCGENYFDD